MPRLRRGYATLHEWIGGSLIPIESPEREVAMSIFLITKEDVYKIDGRPVHVERDKFPGKSYSVRIFKDPSDLLAKKLIGFTDTLMATHKMSEADRLNLAMRRGGRLFAQGSTQDKASVTTDNFEAVQGRKADDEEIQTELMTLIATFFRVQPAERSDVTIHDLFVSTDYRIEDIKRRLLYLANRDLIKQVRTDVFKITQRGFEEVESRGSGVETTEIAGNRYFQVVSLSKKVKEPFAFVLMPFKPQEFDQKVYSDVIKPTVEKELGICCIRSDEETKPGVINNQIFTMIIKAKLIIAETTSRNPNVFYEVGMAHAFNKDVFIFNSSSNKELPFDIITNRAVFYDDYEDLKKKIVENLKDHV